MSAAARTAAVAPRSLWRVLGAAATVVLGGCNDCGVDPVTTVAPQVFADACAEGRHEVNGKDIGGIEACKVSFGERDISVRVDQKVTLTNPSIADLRISRVFVEGDEGFDIVTQDGRVRELKEPLLIPAGLSKPLTVSMRPMFESASAGKLVIISDAKNLPQNDDDTSTLTIDLTITGVDNGLPDVEVSPPECDFGRSPIAGRPRECLLTIKNRGIRDLIFDDVTYVPTGAEGARFDVPPESAAGETAFAVVGNPPSEGQPIAPGAEAVLPVRFAPDVLGSYIGELVFLTNDPDELSVSVPLSGLGVEAPTCVARIKSIGGDVVADGERADVEPLDDVEITLEDSRPATPDGSIVGYRWEFAERAPSSGVDFTAPTSATTKFSFDAGSKIGVDVAGTYRIRGFVRDDLGVESENECTIDFEAVPRDSFLVQLTWDTDEGDMDLHVAKLRGDGYCMSNFNESSSRWEDAIELATKCEDPEFDALSFDDCNYATCSPGDSGVDWDGDDEAGGPGDPTLDVDDTDGYGPENTNVDAMVPGSYLISVLHFSDDDLPPVGNTVRLFIYGRLAGEWNNTLSEFDREYGTWWEVAVVHWPAPGEGQPCVEDLDDGDAADDCGVAFGAL